MNNYVSLILISVAVVAVAIARDRQRARQHLNRAAYLSARDQNFALEACYEGLRCIGYSSVPGCDGPAAAAEAGAAYCKQHGESAILTASLVAAGMVAHYTDQRGVPNRIAAAMLERVNESFAAAFRLSAEKIHDTRMTMFARDPDARAVVEAAARAGFSTSVLAQDHELGEKLRRLAALPGI